MAKKQLHRELSAAQPQPKFAQFFGPRIARIIRIARMLQGGMGFIRAIRSIRAIRG